MDSAVNESANVAASFFHYMEDQIPEERWMFDQPLEPLFLQGKLKRAVGVRQVPQPSTNLVGGFGAELFGSPVMGQWEETAFEFEVAVQQDDAQPAAPLIVREISGKIRTLLRAAARMDDTGESELQVKPPIMIYNYALDQAATTIVGILHIPWYDDGWYQPLRETDPTTPRLRMEAFLIRARYFNRFDQRYTPAT